MDSFLDYFDYRKNEAIKILKININSNLMNINIMSQFSLDFTRVIFFRKFNVDKRILHLSTLIVTNQLSRNEAIKLELNPYSNNLQLNEDKEYFLKDEFD